MTKYANLTDKQCKNIEVQVKELGVIILENDAPAKTTTCNEVVCPICNGALEVYTIGKSYVISCPFDGVITSFRGFSNPSYFKEQPA